ncbi:MAG: hypothetical protein QM654_07055 [Dysgonamonadaceae bacterium]
MKLIKPNQISGEILTLFDEADNIESRTNLKIECIEGGKGYYDTIWATSNKYLQTTIINEPLEREAEYLGESLASFISEVEKIKNYR